MLDLTRTLADRTAAWETVQRLHLPPAPTLPARRATLESAVATVRARTLPPETDLAAYRGVHADRLRAFGEARLRWLLGPAARAGVLEAWLPPATPDCPETAGPVLIEHAVSSDPTALRVNVVRGASIGIDRLELDWLSSAPAAAVTVEATARSAFGPRHILITVPTPVAAAPRQTP